MLYTRYNLHKAEKAFDINYVRGDKKKELILLHHKKSGYKLHLTNAAVFINNSVRPSFQFSIFYMKNIDT